jgi:hypothetical protein
VNYGELKAAVLAETHRPDLSALVGSFIERAEDMLARRLRAAEMVSRALITDAERIGSTSVFQLPSDYLETRAVWAPRPGTGERWVEQRSLSQIRNVPLTAPIIWYATSGDRIEFRGNPSSATVIDMEYYARPATLVDDADTNLLLQRHQELYLAGASFYLYRHTQDLELAQAQLDSLADTIDGLNEQAARHLGSPTVNPVYTFGPGPGGY